MKKCILMLIAGVACCQAMEEEQTKRQKLIIKIPKVRATAFRRQAESLLKQAIIYTLMANAESTIKDEQQAATSIEHYFLAQDAHANNKKKGYEKHLIQALPNKLAAQDLAEIYIEKTVRMYMRASEHGDCQAGVIARGIQKYSLLALLAGERVFNHPTDDPGISALYS